MARIITALFLGNRNVTWLFCLPLLLASMTASSQESSRGSWVDVTLQPSVIEFRSPGTESNDGGGGLAIDALAMFSDNVGLRFSFSDIEFENFDDDPQDDFDVERSMIGLRLAQSLPDHAPELFGELGLGQYDVSGTEVNGLVLTIGMRIRSPSDTELELTLSRHDFEDSDPFFGEIELKGFRASGKAALPVNESVAIVGGIALSEYVDEDNDEIGIVDYNIGLRVRF